MAFTIDRALLISGIIALILSTADGQSDFLGSACLDSVCDNGLPCLSVTDQSTCSSTDMMDSLCTCGGIGEVLDPFFTGFSGQQFYFPAEAGQIYNLFSSEDHLINAQFINNSLIGKPDYLAVASEAENSSYIGAIALWHRNNKIEVQCDEMGRMSVTLNGEGLDFGLDFEVGNSLQMGNSVKLHMDGLIFDFSDMLLLETELLQLTVRAEDYYVHNLGYGVKGHLDTQILLKADRNTAPKAQGILGQTVNSSLVLTQQDSFSKFRNASDYAVSDLYASDFAFNLFKGDKLEKPAIAAAHQPSRGNIQQLTQISRRFLRSTQDFLTKSLARVDEMLTAGVQSRR